MNKKCLPTSRNMGKVHAELQRQIDWLSNHLGVKIPEPPKRYVLIKAARSDLPPGKYDGDGDEDLEDEFFAGHVTKRGVTKTVWTYRSAEAVVYESKAEAIAAAGTVHADLEREYNQDDERCPYKVKVHQLTDEDDD